jgi:signal peptidase
VTRRLGHVFFAVLLAGGIALILALFVVPRVAGYRTFVVVGRSMTGTISRGSLIYSDPVPVATLRVGDVITFAPPQLNEVVTHRIVAIERASDGTQRISTRGDAVPNRDPWQFMPTTPDLPRYVFAIPYAGYLVGMLSLPLVRMLAFALPPRQTPRWYRPAPPQCPCGCGTTRVDGKPAADGALPHSSLVGQPLVCS